MHFSPLQEVVPTTPLGKTMMVTRICDRSGGVALLRRETPRMAPMRVIMLRQSNNSPPLIRPCISAGHSAVQEKRVRSVSLGKPLIDHLKVNGTSAGRFRIGTHESNVSLVTVVQEVALREIVLMYAPPDKSPGASALACGSRIRRYGLGGRCRFSATPCQQLESLPLRCKGSGRRRR